MKSFSIFLLFILFSCNLGKNVSEYDPSQFSQEVNEMVQLLIDTDYIGTERIGRSPDPSPAYANREALLSIANEKELIVLIGHPEGEVAATGFEGLLRRNYGELNKELLNLSKGERKLNYLKGDIAYTLPALEYAYVNLLGNKLEGNTNNGVKRDIGLTEAEKAFVENRINAIRQTL